MSNWERDEEWEFTALFNSLEEFAVQLGMG